MAMFEMIMNECSFTLVAYGRKHNEGCGMTQCIQTNGLRFIERVTFGQKLQIIAINSGYQCWIEV